MRKLAKKSGIICLMMLYLLRLGATQSRDAIMWTYKDLSADSLIALAIAVAPRYETIIKEYNATLYIKGRLKIKKKNFILRYVPSMFKPQKGVRDYLLETYSDLHFTAPNIYDQKVKASQGTIKGHKGIPGMLEYFHVNIYSSSLLHSDKLLSPLARNAPKYYSYTLDSVMTSPTHTDYRILFTPRTKSGQLVEGYIVVSNTTWSVREMAFSGKADLLSFKCELKMGELGQNDEFLPLTYNMAVGFGFAGNKVDGEYKAVLDYTSITLKEENRKREKVKTYNLSDSYSLSCDTNAYNTDSILFASLRPNPLDSADYTLYLNHAIRRDSVTQRPKTRTKSFWGTVGDLTLSDYKFNVNQMGSLRVAPFLNPLLLSYGGSNGWSYKQDFRYNQLFKGEQRLRIVPKIGYNFTHKEFYWSVNTNLEYWPEKRGTLSINFGNGNRIYSSDILDEIKAIPDSIFDFDQIHLDYFNDLYFTLRHKIEIVNGLELGIGVTVHRRTALESSNFVITGNYTGSVSELIDNYKDTYISFAPNINITWTPGLYYYMNGKRKFNLKSYYPTFSLDYERGIKGVFKSTGEYERIEFDLQHQIRMDLMRNIYYRIGFGMFTNQDELYFVDFANFSRHNLPVGWNDEIGGVFQLLDGRWYNSSRKYLRGHFTYEAPFLLFRHLMKYTRTVRNERVYISALTMNHLQPYIEAGYGIGTHLFDLGVFISAANWDFDGVGCKFTFELFNR